MKRILIVEDSRETLGMLMKRFKETMNDVEIIAASNYKDALKAILKYGHTICIAVIDLHIPGSKKGSMLEVVESNNINSIVLSGTLDEESKEMIFKNKNVIDCVAKEGKHSIKNVVTFVNREVNNSERNVLIVDDSKMQLNEMKKILQKMNLNVSTCTTGTEAYNLIMNGEKKFSLVITDYNMPGMNGIELTFKLREQFDRDELSIIAISNNDTPDISAQFLKIGANDFITKPFLEIEVVSRINASLDLIDLFDKALDLANKDFLTGLYNRRYFFDVGGTIFQKATRGGRKMALAMVDIDHFKKINDTYGHEVGDIAICEVSNILKNSLRSSDLISRFGGEEFCILLDDISYEDSKVFFENIRESFEKNDFKVGDTEINLSCSIGVCYGIGKNLEAMIRKADEGLYYCKENGRNRVHFELEEN